MRRIAILLVLALAPGSALACLFESPGGFEVDPASDDTVAPAPIGELRRLIVTRGVGPECDGNSCGSSSCDDLGLISMSFPAAVDDRSPDSDDYVQDGVGYALRVADGSVPDDLDLASSPTAAFIHAGVADFLLVWIDRATDEQEAFDFTLGIAAIDLAGNTSAEVFVDIADPGSGGSEEAAKGDDPLGCATVAAPPVWWGLAASVAAVFGRRSGS